MIETEHLRIETASREEMEAYIAAETDAELKKAYGEMLQGCLDHPELWDWYAIWSIVRKDDGGYEAVLWNLCNGDAQETLELSLSFPVQGDTAALIERVDGESCNPLACWHRMGEPADLTAEQIRFLRAAGQPARTVVTPEQADGGTRLTLALAPNAVVRLRLVPVAKSSDPGYDYGWYCAD